uniref:Uncharacterized protein n=1 Tax=viral metagenome TaxID=1070528 RepID=A0A6M3K683_9ZZZZ
MTEEEKNFRHIYQHLSANKIDDDTVLSGWYSGNKKQFISRHIKAKKMVGDILDAIQFGKKEEGIGKGVITLPYEKHKIPHVSAVDWWKEKDDE